MKKFLLLTVASILLFTILSNAQVPKTLSYQGFLTDMDGNNLTNGEYSINFKLYNQESSGDVLWEETQLLSLEKGVFNAVLGKMVPIDLPFDQQYWLGIMVNTDDEMSPRIALTSSAYSLGNTSPWKVNGPDIFNNTGNVGIGTQNPFQKLDIFDGSIMITDTGSVNNLVDRPFMYFNQIGEADFGGGLIWLDDGDHKLELFHAKKSNELIFYNSHSGYIAAMRDSGSLWLLNQIEPSSIKFRDGSELTSANGLNVSQQAALSVFNYGQTPLIMTDGVETNIHFGNTRFNDNMGYSDGVVTVPYTGLYHFDLCISFPYLYGNEYNIELRVYKNGNLYSQEFIDSYSTDIKLNANDTVSFGVIQHSGVDRELGPFARLSCHKIY